MCDQLYCLDRGSSTYQSHDNENENVRRKYIPINILCPFEIKICYSKKLNSNICYLINCC